MATEQEPSTLITNIVLILKVIMPLLGVVVGGALALIPLGRKLKHDSEEREKERQMSLLHDVYLRAMENIGQELTYLSNLYQTNEVEPTGYYEVIHQIEIIGCDETIVAINKFNDHVTNALYEIAPQKKQIAGLPETPEGIKEAIELTYDLAVKCQHKAQEAFDLLTPVIVAIRKEMGTPFNEKAYRGMKKKIHDNWKNEVEKYAAAMRD